MRQFMGRSFFRRAAMVKVMLSNRSRAVARAVVSAASALPQVRMSLIPRSPDAAASLTIRRMRLQRNSTRRITARVKMLLWSNQLMDEIQRSRGL